MNHWIMYVEDLLGLKYFAFVVLDDGIGLWFMGVDRLVHVFLWDSGMMMSNHVIFNHLQDDDTGTVELCGRRFSFVV